MAVDICGLSFPGWEVGAAGLPPPGLLGLANGRDVIHWEALPALPPCVPGSVSLVGRKMTTSVPGARPEAERCVWVSPNLPSTSQGNQLPQREPQEPGGRNALADPFPAPVASVGPHRRQQPTGESSELLGCICCQLPLCPEGRWQKMVPRIPPVFWLWNQHAQLHCLVELILPGAPPPASFPADSRRTVLPVQAFPQLREYG